MTASDPTRTALAESGEERDAGPRHEGIRERGSGSAKPLLADAPGAPDRNMNETTGKDSRGGGYEIGISHQRQGSAGASPSLAGRRGSEQQATEVRTLSVVSFLNALPLYESLLDRADLSILPAVPSKLSELLAAGRCEAALLPVAAYWRERNRLALISDGCIASDGETMTVRVFSKGPPDRVRRLHVDGDSRTSVVLAQVVWREMYGTTLALAPWKGGPNSVRTADDPADQPEAILLIGDKVVRERPRGFGFEVDLGAAWKHLTGLPFVFAAWFGNAQQDHQALAEELRVARDAGVSAVERIAASHAPRHGWPVDLAITYLRDTMCYTITDPMRAGLERFFELATRHGVLA